MLVRVSKLQSARRRRCFVVVGHAPGEASLLECWFRISAGGFKEAAVDEVREVSLEQRGIYGRARDAAACEAIECVLAVYDYAVHLVIGFGFGEEVHERVRRVFLDRARSSQQTGAPGVVRFLFDLVAEGTQPRNQLAERDGRGLTRWKVLPAASFRRERWTIAPPM